MAIHFVECAALTELPASKKLVLMAIADDADKASRIGRVGLAGIMQWSGLKRSRALEAISQLVDEGFLVRHAGGRIGRVAEFIVFPAGCCALHGPVAGYQPSGSAGPDPQPATDRDPSGSGRPDPAPAERGSAAPDPAREEGPVEGPVEGPTATGPLPISLSTTSPLPPEDGGTALPENTSPSRPSRAAGTNPRALRAAADRAAAEQRQAQVVDERRARQQAIAACTRCSTAGYLPGGQLCSHDPTQADRAARGMSQIRDELAKRRKRKAS